MNEADTASDTSSGSNELLEKCPICLLSFRQQEVGRPEKCDHKFCAQCIHEWSKNVQTCPIDRIEFESIIVFKSYEDQTFTRKIQVDKTTAATSATVEEDSTQCQICERADREEVMLLCDRCDQGYHMDCLSPPLTAIPAGSWFCDNCFSDEEDDPTANISSLYDGLREMGIPESSLAAASSNAPRVLRTRLNERIQAEIFNQRRYNLRTTTTTEIDITRPSTSREIQMRSVASVRIARDTTENIMRLRRRTMSIMRRTKRRTKRRRKKPKTKNIVVEYDLENGQDKKFASKTKKVTIRRRKTRKTRRTSKKTKRSTATRRTAKRRTAKSSCKTVIRVSSTSHEQGSSAPSIIGAHSFSLFGGRNDLEYFDEDEDTFENIPTEIEIATSRGGIASSIRVSNYRTSSNVLRGKSSLMTPSVQTSSVDVLSDILEMQDRWQNASLDKVEIGQDGKLNLNKASPVKPDRTPENQDVQATEAPMYPRGGGSNFNRGGGNNFRFERGGSRGNYSRHSTGNTSYNSSGEGGGSASTFNNNTSGFNNNNSSGGGNFNNSFSGFGNNRGGFNRNNRGGGRNNRNNTFRPRQQTPQQPNSTQQQSQAPPSLLNLSFPPDMTSMDQSQMDQDSPDHGPMMSIPPPPIPPPSFIAVPPPLFNTSLQILSAYGNDEDDGPDEDNHCPNESIYSAEAIKIFSQGDNSGDNSQVRRFVCFCCGGFEHV